MAAPTAPVPTPTPTFRPHVTTFAELLSALRPELVDQLDQASSSIIRIEDEDIDISDIMLEPVTNQNLNRASYTKCAIRQGLQRSITAPLQAVRLKLASHNQFLSAPPADLEQKVRETKKEVIIHWLLTEEQWRIREIHTLLFNPITRDQGGLTIEQLQSALAAMDDYDKGRIKIVKDHFYIYLLGQLYAGPIHISEEAKYKQEIAADPALGAIWIEKAR
ncbi:hypothetical protein ABW19_dt0203759 [Dactylella cylindrospora]|nr:hypothetical protein ABW19_dt0203759 [Dactylella cylindrospora]